MGGLGWGLGGRRGELGGGGGAQVGAEDCRDPTGRKLS